MRQERGFTLLESMVVLGLMTIMSAIAVLNLKKFDQTSSNGANQVAAQLKRARSYAMNSTVTVKVSPSTSNQLIATAAQTCSATTRTTIPELALTLPTGATFATTTWTLCYTSRGLSRDSLSIPVQDSSRTRTVQVVLGGGVRVL